MTHIQGGCFCGAVRFRFDHAPLGIRACWCRDCQYLACGNASVNAFFHSAGLHLEGETATYASRADSGNAMRRRFCPRCGTHLFSEAEARPTLMAVRLGALDERDGLGPTSVIWTGSAPDWAPIDPALPACVAHPSTPPPGLR